MKIGIVGPSEPKWRLEEQKEKAKKIIRSILSIAKNSHGIVNGAYRWSAGDFPSWFNVKPIPSNLREEITLVSGHCHKKGVDIWAEDIADELGVEKEIYHPVCTERGVMRSATLEECQTWYKENNLNSRGHFWQKHFRPRNIKIAKAFEVGFSIVPIMNAYCWHCGKNGHPTNGGCYTVLKGKGMGKEVHIIEV